MAQKKEQKNKEEKTPKVKVEKTKVKEKVAEIKIPVRLEEIYKKEIIPALIKKFNYKSIMEAPRLSKIVLNMGVGAAVADSKVLDEAVKSIETISGQKSSIRTAKKAISNFKLREGMKIGTMVTLRRDKMYEFLDRLINVALPRVRDFRGLSDKSFDGRGNYTIGIKEHIIFPEIDIDKVTKVLGMDITFVSTAKTDAEAFELLLAFGVPFAKKEVKSA
ncbi:MAG: 50S ribosomal protein L5 [Ignavibacteriales bacterium CG12_big_fil_rev_8_21_14_0_65_30_8]|nr:MAG: 50S ribosomal protein L5 [Ignavibacteriales bacterium CG12_big_fil_rev_8_21_14_0_65_30_8]